MDRTPIFVLLFLVGTVFSTFTVREHCGEQPDCLEVGEVSFRSVLEEYDREILVKSINEWIKKKKLTRFNLEVRATPNMGVRVFTRERIPLGSLVFKIDRSLVMTSQILAVEYFDNPSDAQLEHFFEYPQMEGLSDEDKLVFACLYHFTHIETSIFKETLLLFSSSSLLGVLQFTDEELAIIKNDVSLLSQIEAGRQILYQNYKHLRETFENTYSLEQRMSLLGKETIPMAEYLWVRSLVRTHSFIDPTGIRFTGPLMGFLNSDPRGEIKQIGFLKLDDSGNALMQNSRLFEVDDEVVFTLGHYSNNEYLLNYGFVPAGNDYDCLEIPHFSALEINRIGYPIADLAQIIQSKRIECYGATQEQAVIIDIPVSYTHLTLPTIYSV
eukprot:TRINITY_DN4915_c0_g2_i10.p1 TRINITY_DN4915_c0_g2~~TRINITY_DN4915_c0_g2_i10.p1  ORF type:complete len:384 (-),score=21.11 TRINITY_DN4915_c0_g2_i10:36-1187(-)